MYDAQAAQKQYAETQEAGMVERDPDEGSMILDMIREQTFALDDLDIALGNLAKKTKPLKVDLPEKDNSLSGDSRPQLSAANDAILNNINRTRYIATLVRSLTKSLQV